MAAARAFTAAEGSPWTRQEAEALVEDYLAMLECELAGERYNKAAHNRALQRRVPARNRQAIEFKHANVSAVMIALDYRYIAGYKPRWNVQSSLREVVESAVARRPELAALCAAVAERPAETASVSQRRLTLVKVPRIELPTGLVAERRRGKRVPQRVDYSQREERNRSLGLAGELAVMDFEHRRLWDAGHRRLAERIEHVAKSIGDGLGYDVHSFGENGEDRLIEVKTTRGGESMPFFVSRRELDVSVESGSQYHLYRVFDFDRSLRLFTVAGALRDTCALEPALYQGRVR